MNALLLAIWSAIGQADGYAQDFRHDFRGQPLPVELARLPWKDPTAKLEKEGLRMALPKDRKSTGQAGITTTFPIKGNFEITAAYEILHADQPKDGWGVGVTLYVQADHPKKNVTGIARMNRAKDGATIFWECDYAPMKGEHDYRQGWVRSDAKLFRLRLTRSKQTLTYSWAPDLTGDNFRAIGTAEFVGDDLKAVVLNATTGSKPYDLDARFLDLRIRSGVKSLSDAELALSLGERLGRRWRLLVILALFSVSLGGGLITWWLRRRRQIVDGPGS
jgi:hypothetical protein